MATEFDTAQISKRAMSLRKPLTMAQLPEGHWIVAILGTEWRQRGTKTHGYARFLCKCGNEHSSWAQLLRNGGTKSCGCARRECTAARSTKHGRYAGADRGHPLYATWKGMVARCYNPRVAEYPRYGGRGIHMCARWLGTSGFERFTADMGARPDGCTVDRIDNDKGYAPSNCRWATKTQQRRNVRTNRMLAHDGTTLTLAEWAAATGIPRTAIAERVRRGWSVARALETPTGRNMEVRDGH